MESYQFNGDQFVTFAQPDSGFCAVYVWDHVELVFRSFHNISCRLGAARLRLDGCVHAGCGSFPARSAVYCKPAVMGGGGGLHMIVAQLFGGSHIYKSVFHR